MAGAPPPDDRARPLLTKHAVICRAPAAVYPDGKVCISILHEPGVDAFNAAETADERWRPILGVEQVLVSVIAMLNEPNIESPANVDAAKVRTAARRAIWARANCP